MAYRVLNNRLYADRVEADVVDHCNISCRSCDHLSPIAAKGFVDPDQLERDLTLLATRFRARDFLLLGGEPLLHPRLSHVAAAVRRSGVADQIILVTNGLLLNRATDELWRNVDCVQVNVYPGREPSVADLERVQQASRAGEIELFIKPIKAFKASYSESVNDSPALVQRIYNTCDRAHADGCFAVRNGYFYKCGMAHVIPARVVKQDGWDSAQDGVKLDDPETLSGRLLAYLTDSSPLKACQYCLGTVGVEHAHEQLPRSKWRAPQMAGAAGSIDWSWLFLKEHRILGRMGMHLYRVAKPLTDPTLQMEAEGRQPWRTLLDLSAKVGQSNNLVLRSYYVVRSMSRLVGKTLRRPTGSTGWA